MRFSLGLLMLILPAACSAHGQQLGQSPSPTVSRALERGGVQRSVPLAIHKLVMASPRPRNFEPKWSAQLPTRNGEAVLLSAANVYIASGGLDARAFNSSNGKLLWLRHDLSPPLYLYHGLLFGYDHRDGKVASVDAQTGVTRWSQDYCNHRAPDFISGGTRNLIIECSALTAGEDERWNVGLSYLSGAVIYRRSFKSSGTMFDSQQRITGDIISVLGGFNGAWMGSTLDLVDASTGKQIFQATDVSIAGIRSGIVMFNDLCCLERLGVYEPARIGLVNATSGKMGGTWSLTPDSDRNVDHGNSYDFGRAQLSGSWLYLTVGPILYRYRLTANLHPDVDHPQLLIPDLQDDPIFMRRHILIRTGDYRTNRAALSPSTIWSMEIKSDRATLKPLARGSTILPVGSFSPSSVYKNDFMTVLQDQPGRSLFFTESAKLYRPDSACPYSGFFAGASHKLAMLCSSSTLKGYATHLTLYGFVFPQ